VLVAAADPDASEDEVLQAEELEVQGDLLAIVVLDSETLELLDPPVLVVFD